MAQPPTSEPGPAKAGVSATGALRAQPRNSNFETDLAQLAAVFSAHGGGVSPELSKNLALEIVLNEIVVQACLSTGATGAAIALERDGEMVCRASNGETAPALGLAAGLRFRALRRMYPHAPHPAQRRRGGRCARRPRSLAAAGSAVGDGDAADPGRKIAGAVRIVFVAAAGFW